jgi:hypothetical protein
MNPIYLDTARLLTQVAPLVFLPALYAIWFKIRPAAGGGQAVPAMRKEAIAA